MQLTMYSPNLSLYKIVVLPALSRPIMIIRCEALLAPTNRLNAAKMFPMKTQKCLQKEVRVILEHATRKAGETIHKQMMW